MASSVNRRTAECGSFLSLPRRYNRTAVDRLAYGCMGLSDDGVSVELHQTLIQGSATLAREPRRLRDRNPTPKKLIRPPTPALQNGGFSPKGRPSWVLARREGSHTADVQGNPPGCSRPGAVLRANPTVGVRGIGVSAGSRTQGPQPSRAQHARPKLAPVRPPAPRHGPAGPHPGRSRSPSLRGDRPRPGCCLLRGEEPFAVEDLALTQQVVDGSAQASGQGSQGPRLAVFLLAAGQPLLGLLVLAEEQAGRLREGPFEVGIADLVAAGALLLAGRVVGATDQPGVGEELADLGEAADVVDLVEEDEGQDLADAGHGAQAVEGLGIIDLGRAGQIQFETADLLIVGIDQGQIDFDVLANTEVGEALRDVQLLAVLGVGELLGEGRQVVLAVGVDQVDQGLGATADQESAAAEQVTRLTHAFGIDVGLGEHAAAQ